MPPLLSLVVLISVLVWALYNDTLLVKGRLAASLSLTAFFTVATFLLSPHRNERNFLVRWIVGLTALVLASFAWTGLVAYWPGSVAALLFAILFLSIHLGQPLIQLAPSLFCFFLAVVFFFLALVLDGHLTAFPLLSLIVYLPWSAFFLVLIFVPLSYLVPANSSPAPYRTFLILDTLLIGLSLHLLAMIWMGQSSVLTVLAVQPLIGVLFLHGVNMLKTGARLNKYV